MENGNAVDWFVDRHQSGGSGQRLAFQDPWRSLTYAELQAASKRFAGHCWSLESDASVEFCL